MKALGQKPEFRGRSLLQGAADSRDGRSLLGVLSVGVSVRCECFDKRRYREMAYLCTMAKVTSNVVSDGIASSKTSWTAGVGSLG